MTESQDSFEKRKYIKGNRFSTDSQLEEVVAERIRLWKKNALSTDVERIFPVSGFPGVGKTWLFLYFTVYRKIGVYLDLDGFSKADTPNEYLNYLKACINSDGKPRKKNIFFLDHVPPAPLHPNLEKVENEILIPQLEQGSLFFIAQQNPYSWCWNHLNHPPPYIVRGFDAEGKKKLFRKLEIPKPKKNQFGYALFDATITLPKMVAIWQQFQEQSEGEVQAVEDFLAYWLMQIVPFDNFDLKTELYTAGALTWINSFLDNENISHVLDIINTTEYSSVVCDRLARYQWITIHNTWVEAVRKLLQLWFRQEKPELASLLDQQIGD